MLCNLRPASRLPDDPHILKMLPTDDTWPDAALDAVFAFLQDR